MRIYTSFAVFLLLSGGVVQAELLVEILGMPAEVYSFEPIYVLSSVQNRGAAPVLLPNGGLPREGMVIYFAPKGEVPRYVTHLDFVRSFPLSETSKAPLRLRDRETRASARSSRVPGPGCLVPRALGVPEKARGARIHSSLSALFRFPVSRTFSPLRTQCT